MDQIELNQKQIERSLFIARQKVRWRHWLIFFLMFLIAVSVAVLFNGLFTLSLSFGTSEKIMSQLVKSDVDWQALHAASAPKDLALSRVVVLPLGNGRYDFTAEVYNPNAEWAIESIDYQFSAKGQAVANGQTSLLPGERRLLTILSYQLSDDLDRPDSVVLSSYKWRKYQLSYSDAWQYNQAPRYRAKQIIGEGVNRTVVPPQVTWTVTNNTGNNFLHTSWQVALYQGSTLVAVDQMLRDQVPAYEAIPFSLNVFDSGARIDRVEVTPIVDYFNPDNRYLPSVDPTFDPR